MTRRYALRLLLAFIAAAGPLRAAAQSTKMYRIGVLSLQIPRDRFRVVPEALRERGYVEGRNIEYVYRYAEGHPERLESLAGDLAAQQVDLILCAGNQDVLAAKNATRLIPIVMMFSLAPVEVRLIDSLARPGGNVTGTTIQAPETAGKMVEVLRDAVPGLRQIAVIWEEGFPGMDLYRRAGERAIEVMNLQWTLFPVRNLTDLEVALTQISRRRPDALFVVPTSAIYVHRALIIDFAARQRLPALYTSDALAREGGLIAYTADTVAVARRSAAYVDRILKGAKPAELPVEQPTKFNLVINLRAAKAIDLAIPQSLLARADELIE